MEETIYVSLTINQNIYTNLPNHYSLIQHCEFLNIPIPRFCYHEELSIAGNCRMCLIEIENSPKPIIACATNIVEDMVISTNSVLVLKAREFVMEFLLINHPLDCPICDQGGECDLQDQSLIYGKDTNRFVELKRAVVEKNWGSFIKTIMTRCIHCTRCIRYFNEIVGLPIIGTLGRGSLTEVDTYIDIEDFNSEIMGNVIDLCPVGALTSKPASFTYRNWEFRTFETIDLLDSFCSYIRIDVRGNEVIRISPLVKSSKNESWITDKIRFSYDGFKKQRLLSPFKKMANTSKLKNISWENAYNYFINNYNYCLKKKWLSNIYIFTGEFIDLESLFMVKFFTSIFGISNINIDFFNDNDIVNAYTMNNSIYNTDFLNVYIIYNINIKIENSILNMKLRKISIEQEQEEDTLFFYIGHTIELNYEFTQIGLEVNNLIDIYYGRHFCCYYMNNISYTHFITGSESNYEENNYLYISLNLRLNLGYNINYHKNNLHSGEVLVQYTNATSDYTKLFIDRINYIPKMLYLIGYDSPNYSFELLQNCFIIYQGHHADYGIMNANLILPSVTFIEKKGFYMNCFGEIEFANSILDTIKGNNYSDTSILFTLIKYSNNKTHSLKVKWCINFFLSKYMLVNNEYMSLKIPIISKKTKHDIQFTVQLFMYTKQLYNRYAYIEDALFWTNNRNFYNMDVFCRASLNINKKLKTLQFNFKEFNLESN